MQLSTHTHTVAEQLAAAAALGDERTRQIAAALAETAQSAVRLAVLDALTAAGVEITDALYNAGGGSASPAVTVQLEDGDTIRFIVSGPPPEPAETSTRAEDGEATARISLRLSDSLKGEIEAAAARADASVNSWLVRAATSALAAGTAGGWGNWSAWAGPGGPAGHGARRVTGWVTG